MDQVITELNLIPMTRDHLGAVVDIEREIYPFPWTHGNFVDSIKAGYEASVVHVAGAPELANPVGYAVVMHILDEVHLLNISIAAPRQGLGFGRRLLRKLIERAVKSGARGMFLEVRPSNGPALKLYEDEGFLRIGLRRNYYPSFNKTREDAIVMRRALQP